MAKSVKKKANRRLKRSVRRTLGALCMMTAIIVAAIPFPDAAAANGDPVGQADTGYPYSYTETKEVPAFDKDDDYLTITDSLNQSETIYSDENYAAYDEEGNPTAYKEDNHTAYTIYQNSSMAWQMDWQFEYYAKAAGSTTQDKKVVLDGLITKYNGQYKKDAVNLDYQVYSDYIYITQEDYTAFLSKTAATPTIKVNAYKNMKADKTNPQESDCKIYQAEVRTLYYPYIIDETPDHYNEHPDDEALQFYQDYPELLKEYNAYITQYQDYLRYQQYIGLSPEEQAAIAKPPAQTDKPASLLHTYADVIKSDVERVQFFCNQVFGGATPMELIGVVVRETSETVYIPRLLETPKSQPVSINGPLYWADKGNFLADKTNTIAGIGKNAFKGVTNVITLTMADEIDFIGDSAFENSFVQNITFVKGAKIGNAAFKGCKDLATVDMTAGVKEIGAEAFSATNALQEVVIPNAMEKIGAGAFYNCPALKNVTFNNCSATIEKFAFFDCPSLEKVDFLNSGITKIGDCVFALSMNPTGNLTDFYFPNTLSDGDMIGEFIFGGRTNLRNVTMPTNLGTAKKTELKNTIFYNCSSLASVTFPETCYNVYYEGYDPEDKEGVSTIFRDVKNPEFYVRGPMTNGAGGTALPRESTWTCTFGDTTNGEEPQSVPYVFNDKGVDYFEICDEAGYLSVITGNNGNGTLVSSSFMPGKEMTPIGTAEYNALTGEWDIENAYQIPAKVGTTQVTSIADKCFEGNRGILDYIVALEIADGSGITNIGDNVFRDADRLKYVSIGNGVTNIGNGTFADNENLQYVEIGTTISNIGADAFKDSTGLENIKFVIPEGGVVPNVTIGENAFSTGGNKLTIEGLIDENYGPFKWAMNPNSFMDPVKGVRVLYKSPAPQNMSVILDNKNNMPTLVDYPHFGDLDSDLQNSYENNEAFGVTEANLVDACLNVKIPSGVKSVDAKAYFNNDSVPKDGITVNKGLNNEYSIKAYFYNDAGTILESRYNTYKDGGLFAAAYDEYNDTSVDKHEKEKEDLGNDRLQSVEMASVEYLPDQCFYSCENLQKVLFSDAMTDVGSLPFELCTNLLTVGGSSSYACNNGILYKNNSDGTTKTLVECLASRGTENGPGQSTISIKNDPDLLAVKEIEPGAFRNCEELISADFVTGGTAQFTSVPEECFMGDDLLAFVYLPESVSYIAENAFADTGKSTDVWLYGKSIVLADNIFGTGDDKVDKPKVTTYEDSPIRQLAKDKGYDVSEVIPTDGTLSVTFFVRQDSGLVQVAKLTGVQPGTNVRKEAPDEVDLADYIKEGYELVGWEGTQDLTNITETCIFVAKIVEKDTDGDGVPDSKDEYPNDPNNNGNGNGGTGDTPGGDTGNTPGGDTGNTPGGNNGNTGGNSGNTGDNSGNTGGNGGNSGGSASDNNPSSDSTKKYTLTVVYGSGSGTYASGSTLIIEAIDAPAGKEFYKWTTNNTGVTITSATSKATTIKTTNSDAVVTATYRDKSSVSSNTVNRKPIGSSSGSTVQISKPGISNTDKAYASVSGSTDNFVVKITESTAAANAVATALANTYYDMNPIKYFAMDISLYDKNGNQVTNTNGLSVNVTMPIPDALVQYGGNNKVGAVVNGNTLEPLNCKFTTVSGIPCVTFTATHFSPYTIYVDTSNLSVNTLDSTPKTGDGIHPKWFFSIGLACISLLLFMKKDKVTPRKAMVS